MSGRTRTKTDTRSGHFNDGDASVMITKVMMMMITKVMMIIRIKIVIVIAKVMMKTIAKIMTVLFSGL